MIGERVRHVRAYYGWSQAELAQLIGVSQPAISQIEKGGPAADSTIAAIAQVSQFSLEWFARGSLPDLPEGSLRFRKRASTRVRDDERVRAHVRQVIEALGDLQGVAKFPPVRIEPVVGDLANEDALEELASATREFLGVGQYDPIPNLTRAIERAGVAVVGSVQQIEKHWGASYWPDFPYGRPVVCFTRGMSGDSQRLTIAHELGHLILHQLRSVPIAQAEAEAFRFAGALLIPQEVARVEIERPVTLRQLGLVKARWGISIRALVRRCLDLHLIDSDRRTSLEKQISARGWHKVEPVEVPPEQPALVGRALELVAGTKNPRALAHRLGLPPLVVNDMLA